MNYYTGMFNSSEYHSNGETVMICYTFTIDCLNSKQNIVNVSIRIIFLVPVISYRNYRQREIWRCQESGQGTFQIYCPVAYYLNLI